MEKHYRVYMTTTATRVVEVAVDVDGMDDDEINEAVREAAYNEAYVSLCHHCAGQIDLGDFEIGDDDGDVVEL